MVDIATLEIKVVSELMQLTALKCGRKDCCSWKQGNVEDEKNGLGYCDLKTVEITDIGVCGMYTSKN